jgi:YVTN family beta-propeller protein
LAVTPDGMYVLVLNVTSGEVTLISASSQKVMGTVRVGDMPISVAIAADSKLAYVANRISNSVSVVDIAARKVVGTIKCGQAPTSVMLGADSKHLYVSTGRDNSITEYDCASLAKLRELRLPAEMEFPGGLCLLPDGHHSIVLSHGAESFAILDLDKLEAHSPAVTLGHANHEAVWEPVP